MKIVIRNDEKKDKAVSAIIGTILIVAITVVLAATLYAVLGGFGGLIGKPTPTMGVTVSSVGGGTGTGGSYSISINSLSANVPVSDLSFTLTESSGTSVTVTGFTASSGTATATDSTGFEVSITPLGTSSSGASTIELQSIITITFTPPSGSPYIGLSSFSVIDTATSGSMVSNVAL